MKGSRVWEGDTASASAGDLLTGGAGAGASSCRSRGCPRGS